MDVIQQIQVLEAGIEIRELDIPSKDVADFLRAVPEQERQLQLQRAIEVGVFCLQRAQGAQDLEFVRRQIDALLVRVQNAVEKIPQKTQESLVSKLGTGDGQVLEPIVRSISDVSKSLSERIKEVQNLYAEEIDPAKDTSTLGKTLRTLRELLDPKRTDSVQGLLSKAIEDVTKEGGQLGRTVNQTVSEAIKPLKEEVDRLAKIIHAKQAVKEVVDQTTLKGRAYEDEVTRTLQEWGNRQGWEVDNVGVDNKPGDVLLCCDSALVDSDRLAIVVEARDRGDPAGRKKISDDLNDAMVTRAASLAVYVSKTGDGLGKEIGEWAEGENDRGPFVACTHDHLVTAVRFLVVKHRLSQLRASQPEVDAASIEQQVQRIRTSLDHVKNINRKVTDIQGSSGAIKEEADKLREEVKTALEEIESAIRAVQPPGRQPRGNGRDDKAH